MGERIGGGKGRVPVFAVCALAVLIAAGATFMSACSDDVEGEYNVILVSIDTLRQDHVGCYGYGKETSPSVDLFSRDAVIFRDAVAQAPSTEPSHASIFTSLIPSHHGALFARKQKLPDEAVTMAEMLKEEGFRTASFNGGAQMSERWGFGQGFDIYESYRGKIEQENFRQKVKKSIAWLDESGGDPFFLFLHTYEVHHPYTPDRDRLALFDAGYAGSLPDEISVDLLKEVNKGERLISEEDQQHIINAYDAEISSVDEAFGELLRYLKDRGLYDRTLIIFTSDHGEEFGEHGFWGWHSHTVYDELLKIPLIVKFPFSKYASMEVGTQTRSIDILPTILDVLRIPPLDHFEGRSLAALLENGEFPEYAISEQDMPEGHQTTSIRTGGMKFLSMDGGRKEFYLLESDPEERNNLVTSGEHSTLVTGLAEQLEEALLSRDGPDGEEAAPLDEEAEERLKALGYLK